MSRPRSLRTRLAVAAVTAPLALGLVACGGDSDESGDAADSADAAVSVPPSSTAASATPDDTSSAPAPSESAATPAAPGDGALQAAAATGLAAVDGGTVFSVDRSDAGGWEVSVVDGDGTEYDVRVSADGSAVEGDPVEDTSDDDAGEVARDADERQRLLGVSVDYLAAIDAASGSADGAELTGLDLDEDNGRATWDVQYGEDTAQELTVVVDADSGAVLSTELDD